MNANKLIYLNEIQLRKLNEWFLNYDSTLKNVIAIIKGNNPGDSFSLPNNAEIIVENIDEQYKSNIIMFIDKIINLSTKNNYDNQGIKNNLESYWNNQVSQNEYVNYIKNENTFLFLLLNSLCKKVFHWRDLQIKKMELKDIIDKIEKTIDEYFYLINLTKDKLNNARKSLPDLENIIVFENIQEKFTNFERAHIFPFSEIKNETLQYVINYCSNNYKLKEKINEKLVSEIINKGIGQIKSIDNLLNLPNNIHDAFDKDYFTYNENGEVVYWKKKKSWAMNFLLFKIILLRFLIIN